MMYRVCGALIASLGVSALLLAADEALAKSGGAAGRGGVASAHAMAHPPGGPSFRHHRRNNIGGFWPGGGFYYGPSSGEPIADGTQSVSGDIRYTYTYDVPWDWAHRYPPAVTPSDRPYVQTCPAETVTVPGRDGSERTVNIMRCY